MEKGDMTPRRPSLREESSNPLHHQPLKKDNSSKDWSKKAEEEIENNAGRLQEKAAGRDFAEVDAANNAGAFDQLASGEGIGEVRRLNLLLPTRHHV